MATIRDVARRAGVSTMTVSRVLNRSGYVSAATQARVESAIAELGYLPNTLGLSLRFKQTNTLALVLSDVTNPFFTTMARGAEDVASDAGFSIILCNTDECEEEQARYLDILLRRRVDGVLLVPARSRPDAVEWIQKRDVPLVVLDRRVPGASVDVVRCESAEGAYRLTQLLLGLGHRHIAMLSGPTAVSTAYDRVEGFQRALRESGVPCRSGGVRYGDFSVESGYQMLGEALALYPTPTAVFASNNLIAIGAHRALRNAGLRVPDDMAMVAFDDLPERLLLDPFFTVASQPAYEMGRRATELLLARISGEAAPDFQEVLLPVEIIIRQSSGHPVSREWQSAGVAPRVGNQEV